MSIVSITLIAVFVFLYGAFLFWYGGRGKPLSQAEVDGFLTEMKKRAGKQGLADAEAPILSELREL